MISYLIQVAVTCLIGILLPTLIWLLNLRTTGSTTPLLKKYQTLIFETNGFLSITFLVGAIFHYSDSPSVLEACFLSSLVNTQLFITIGMIWSQWADTMMNKSNVGSPYILYHFAIFIAQLATLCTIKLKHKAQYVDMAKECHKQHQLIDLSTSVAQFSDGTTALKWIGIGLGIGFCAVFLIHVLLSPWKKLRSKIPSWVKEYGLILLYFLVMVVYVVAIVMGVIPTEKVRRLVRQTSMIRSEKLGYGQTTAVLIWFPFFFACLKKTISWSCLYVIFGTCANGRKIT